MADTASNGGTGGAGSVVSASLSGGDLSHDFVSALDNLYASMDAFAGVARRIEQKFKELQKKDAAVQRLHGRKQEVRSREAHVKEKERELSGRKKELEEKEARLSEIEVRMASNVAAWENKVHLNIGGQEFATSKATLLQFKGSLFEELLMSNHEGNEAKFFIDRDPKYFPALLNYMRDGKFRNSDTNFGDPEELQADFAYYRIPFPDKQTLSSHIPQTATISHSVSTHSLSSISRGTSLPVLENVRETSDTSAPTSNQDAHTAPHRRATSTRALMPRAPTLTRNSGSMPNVLFTTQSREGIKQFGMANLGPISHWLPNHKFYLLYKARRDGFSAADFHKLCDNKGPTLTMIQSKEGFLFGGYTPVSWDSSNTTKSHPECFIFTLSNPHFIPPTKYVLGPGEQDNGICCKAACGPVFGKGPDIYVHSDSNQNSESYTFFPSSYTDTTGKGAVTFTGTFHFTTKKIKVYSVV